MPWWAWPTAQPGWYAHFLTDLGNLFSTSGTETAWILALIAVIIGVGPLVARRPGVYLLAGAVVAFVLWIAGQGLIGNLFTGSDTDPNTGPIIILLAAAMTPLVIATRAEWRSPAGEMLRRTPAVGILGVVGLAAALSIVASYPAAPPSRRPRPWPAWRWAGRVPAAQARRPRRTSR